MSTWAAAALEVNQERQAEMVRLRAPRRRPFGEIGRRVGLSGAAVSLTLKRLGRAGHLAVVCRECAAIILASSPSPPGGKAAALCLACLARHPAAPFGERLRTHRLAAGWLQTRLAAAVGVTKDSDCPHYGVGGTRPTPAVLARLVAVLGRGLLPPGDGAV